MRGIGIGGDQAEFRVHPARHHQPVSVFGTTGMKQERKNLYEKRNSDPLGPEFCVGYREVHMGRGPCVRVCHDRRRGHGPHRASQNLRLWAVAAVGAAKKFLAGRAAGFCLDQRRALAIFALHGFRITGLAIHGTTILTATLAWTGACVAIGLCEESVFRGYPLFTLTTGIGTAKLPAQVSAALNDNLAGSSTRVVDAPRFHVCPRAYIRISERCAKGI